MGGSSTIGRTIAGSDSSSSYRPIPSLNSLNSSGGGSSSSSSSSHLQHAYETDPLVSIEARDASSASSAVPISSSQMTLSEILEGITKFSNMYWCLIVFMVGFLLSQQVWSNFATDIFVERFQLTSVLAGRLNSIPTTISVVLCPLLGVYIDMYGHTRRLLLVGSILLLIGHVVLAVFARRYQSTHMFVSCEIVLGLGMGVVQAALWPSLALSIPPHLVGTGMGIASAMANSAMVVFPLITGVLHDVSGSYLSSMYMFVGADTFCIAVCLILMFAPFLMDLKEEKVV